MTLIVKDIVPYACPQFEKTLPHQSVLYPANFLLSHT